MATFPGPGGYESEGHTIELTKETRLKCCLLQAALPNPRGPPLVLSPSKACGAAG